MVALNRAQALLTSLLEVTIAEATLLKFVLRLQHALESWEQQAMQTMLAAPSLHVDETSLRVDKVQHWNHVYASGEVTLKRACTDDEARRQWRPSTSFPATGA